MEKGYDGRIGTQNPHPLSPWFDNPESCFRSKHNLVEGGLLKKFPLHQNAMPLVSVLRHLWMDRFRDQQHHTSSEQVSSETAKIYEGGHISRLLPPDLVESKEAIPKNGPYEELLPEEWFRQVFRLLLREIDVVPQSKANVCLEVVNLVAAMYPFVRSEECARVRS